MALIYIENKPYEVKEGENLLQVCLSLGFNLPYFCWHPAMGAVGSCRLCAVKQYRDENDREGKIIMSCMTPAADGMRISIKDAEAAAFRAQVIEWLMLNHPHDCPICDEGGECHLQDMTVMTGHNYRKTRFRKRTFQNQYLGPFINHEMNRCIECYRCVRFYRDYAGGRDLNVFASRNNVYFGRSRDGVLENEFSGNLVEVCPTGVFTDKTLKAHYTRKWDLQMAPSVCVHCALGCNIIAGERYGSVRRILNRYNGQVNGYFLCDRGRFGYEFVNSERRIRMPRVRERGSAAAQPSSREQAIEHVRGLLSGGGGIIGIGSPRASLEANFVLRALAGEDSYCSGMSDRDSSLVSLVLKILREGPARTPGLAEVELCDAVLILGEDTTSTAPRLSLSLRQSVRQKPMEIADRLSIPHWNDSMVREALQDEKGPLFVASTAPTGLDDVATETYHAAPDDIARLGFAVAHEIDKEAPQVPDLPKKLSSLARRIAKALDQARRPLVISGLGCQSEAVVQAAANTAFALCRKGRPAELLFTLPESNSLGVGLLGGVSLADVQKKIQEGTDTVIVLENDLYRRAPRSRVDGLLEGIKHLIVLDHLESETTSRAEVVLPAATFAEGTGTLVSSEGRAQRFFQVFVPQGDVEESWQWLRDILAAAGRPEAGEWGSPDDLRAALAKEMPEIDGITVAAPSAEFRMAGQKIPRMTPRATGRTSMTANISVHEPKPPEDREAPFNFSMEGYGGKPPSSLVQYYWAPGWNSGQSLSKFQDEVGGPLRGGDPGLRLIEPGEGSLPGFDQIPGGFEARGNEFLIVPIYHIFGSEELSILSPGVAERAPGPYLALSPEEAKGLKVEEGDEVELDVSGSALLLPVKIRPGLPKGVAGIPAGIPGLERLDLLLRSKVKKVKSS